MSMLKKLGIALIALILILVLLFVLLTSGGDAKVAFAKVTGPDPVITEANAETIPTVDIAEPIGWGSDGAPTPAAGLSVTRFAEGLDHPRTLYTLPNGDVLAALTRAPGKEGGGGLTDWVAGLLMKKAGATGPSPNQIVLLRDSNGDGIANQRSVLLSGLNSPSGMAWHDGMLYVANNDAVLAYPYQPGQTTITAKPRKLMDLPAGGNHWMRNLIMGADGKSLFIAVGSASNIGENGMAAEEGRAMIWQYDLETNTPRMYGGGLRNPNGMAISPWSGELWTVVNERDMLGSDLVPDYLTNVPIGVQYGWPWVYWKDHFDRRVKYDYPEYINYVRKPEYSLGPHVAPLGLVFSQGGAKLGPNFASGAFVAEHGSWNRKPPSGYDVVYVKFDARGNPTGKPIPVLTGFLTADGKTHGRPTWLAWAKDGALLLSDDTAGIVWRIIDNKAAAQAPISAVKGESLTPLRELRGSSATFGADDYARVVPAQ